MSSTRILRPSTDRTPPESCVSELERIVTVRYRTQRCHQHAHRGLQPSARLQNRASRSLSVSPRSVIEHRRVINARTDTFNQRYAPIIQPRAALIQDTVSSYQDTSTGNRPRTHTPYRIRTARERRNRPHGRNRTLTDPTVVLSTKVPALHPSRTAHQRTDQERYRRWPFKPVAGLMGSSPSR